ncbi:MAG: hypothetical protein WCD31_03355, partial [Gillisia sp.]
NTAACLYHHHEERGRPNRFKYGKMVVNNGWYVWRVKYPKPMLKARAKWNLTHFLLLVIRIKNGWFDSEKGALKDAMGRFSAYISLIFTHFNRDKSIRDR